MLYSSHAQARCEKEAREAGASTASRTATHMCTLAGCEGCEWREGVRGWIDKHKDLNTQKMRARTRESATEKKNNRKKVCMCVRVSVCVACFSVGANKNKSEQKQDARVRWHVFSAPRPAAEAGSRATQHIRRSPTSSCCRCRCARCESLRARRAMRKDEH